MVKNTVTEEAQNSFQSRRKEGEKKEKLIKYIFCNENPYSKEMHVLPFLREGPKQMIKYNCALVLTAGRVNS